MGKLSILQGRKCVVLAGLMRFATLVMFSSIFVALVSAMVYARTPVPLALEATRQESQLSSYAQSSAVTTAPPMEWSQTYGGSGIDVARSVVQTDDGGYALAGYTTELVDMDNQYYFFLVKADAAGNEQWNEKYSTPADAKPAEAHCVVQTNDKGYALVGYYTGSGMAWPTYVWLVKTDSAGNEQWNKEYSLPSEVNEAYSLVQTSDEGFAIAGTTAGGDFWLVKTNSAGNMEWSQTYGGSANDVARSVVQTDDGGYALAGYTKSYGVGTPNAYNFWLVKTNSAGNMEWSRTYGGTEGDQCYSMVQTGDEGFALAGYTSSFGAGGDFWLVKTNSAGNMEWSQTYGGSGIDVAYSLVQTSDEGFAIAGTTAGGDFWLVKTNSAGNMEWSRTYGGTEGDQCYSMVQTSDDGYALAGYTDSGGAGGYDFWLIKVAPVQHELTIDVVGSGTTDPAPSSYTHAEDAEVTVDAIPNSGWKLDHWELDDVDVGADDPYTVTMDADHTLTAVFVEAAVLPEASFTYSPSTPKEGEAIDFDASNSSDGAITSHAWDFGDGTTGTGVTATHTYTKEGTYTVTLTVGDATGNSDTDTVVITVQGAEAAFPLWVLAPIVGGIACVTAVSVYLRKRKPKEKVPKPAETIITAEPTGTPPAKKTAEVLKPPEEFPPKKVKKFPKLSAKCSDTIELLNSFIEDPSRTNDRKAWRGFREFIAIAEQIEDEYAELIEIRNKLAVLRRKRNEYKMAGLDDLADKTEGLIQSNYVESIRIIEEIQEKLPHLGG